MRLYTALFTVLLAVAFIGCATTATKTDDKKADTKKEEKTETTEKKDEKTETKPEEKESAANMSSPKETIATFVAAIQKKDGKTIKNCLSKASLTKLEETAKETKKPIDELLIEMFEDEEMNKVPEMKNEKIDGDKATLDIKDAEMDKWDTVPFVKEDGAWKIAFDKAQG